MADAKQGSRKADPPSSGRVVAGFPAPQHAHDHCVADALAAADRVCAARGARLTALRRTVLEIIWSRHAAIGAYDILDLLRERGRSAAPVTIYRTIEFLLGMGLVHRIESLNAFIGCGAPGEPHRGQFLICSRCRTVAEIADEGSLARLEADAKRLDFAAERITVEVLGLCAACRAPA